jgi:hypothetical protein
MLEENDSDMDAKELFDEIRKHLSEGQFNEELDQLEELVEISAFGKAKAILASLLDKTNVA